MPQPQPNPNPTLTLLYPPLTTQASMVREYGPDMVWNFMMFKRSYNARRDGVHLAYPHIDRRDVFPLTYAISETYSRAGDSAVDAARPTEIACTLRGHKKMSTRQRVQDWVGAYSADRGIADKVVLGAVNKGSRDRVNEAYFQQMRSTKIVVTGCTPHTRTLDISSSTYSDPLPLGTLGDSISGEQTRFVLLNTSEPSALGGRLPPMGGAGDGSARLRGPHVHTAPLPLARRPACTPTQLTLT